LANEGLSDFGLRASDLCPEIFKMRLLLLAGLAGVTLLFWIVSANFFGFCDRAAVR